MSGEAPHFYKALSWTHSNAHDFYTLTLAPGLVRFLKFADFFAAGVEDTIVQIKQLSETPEVKCHQWATFPDSTSNLKLAHVDVLASNESWDARLRIHHALGRLHLDEKMPPEAYLVFHKHLALGKHFAFAESLGAWVKGTGRWGGEDLSQSYTKSSGHLVVQGDSGILFVFRKTEFVQDRLSTIAKENAERAAATEATARSEREQAEHRRTMVELETVEKSNFITYVYLMEDLRNGAFKIGHSRTPTKRERTLQSEVPEINLRFSIPGKEEHEKELHRRLSHKNQRGEWFTLTHEEVLWVISYLKENGDSTRATVDHAWFAKVFFTANPSKSAK